MEQFPRFITINKEAGSYFEPASLLFSDLKIIFYSVKYSPPIEAGASFNPPNLAKDFILQASVSEAMGFL